MTGRAGALAEQNVPSEQDLPSALRRSGAVCHDLASTVEWLQDQFGALMDSGRMTPCRETTIALQDLDRIAQVLHGLARLNIELGEHTGGLSAPRGRLASALHLDSLASQVLDGEAAGEIDDELWH